MKQRILIPLCLLLLLSFPARAEAQGEEPSVSAQCAIVLEPETNTALYEKEPDRRMLIASTTKIMTALVVLERCALDETLIATEEQAAVEGSSMLLEPGETYTVEEVLYGLLLASGNDAAAALAEHCAGSMEAFAALMNEKAAALGLENTHFENSHGLDAPEHYSTARELAQITSAAMENATFRTMFSTVSHTVHGITYQNHNQLLTTCPGCIGGKTGYTMAAGRILVSVTEREGMRLICVTIADPDDWADHIALYDALFARWRFLPLPQEGWQRVETLSGVRGFVPVVCDTSSVLVPKEGFEGLDVRLPRFTFAPVTAGEEAGSVSVLVNGTAETTLPLYYGETVPVDRAAMLNAWDRFRKMWFFSSGTGIYYWRP